MRHVFILSLFLFSTIASAVIVRIDGKNLKSGHVSKLDPNMRPRAIEMQRGQLLAEDFNLVPSWTLSFEFDNYVHQRQFLEYMNGSKRKNRTGVALANADRSVYVALPDTDPRWPSVLEFLHAEVALPGEILHRASVFVGEDEVQNLFIPKFRYKAVQIIEVWSRNITIRFPKLHLVFSFENSDLRDKFYSFVSVLNNADADITFVNYDPTVFLILPSQDVHWKSILDFLDKEVSIPEVISDRILSYAVRI